MSSPPLRVSVGSNAYDNHPVEHVVSFAELADLLISSGHVGKLTLAEALARKAQDKQDPTLKADKDTRYFQFAAFNGTRSNANVIAVSGFCGDFDAEKIEMDKVQAKLADVAHLIHTTYSHSEEHPRFRVLVPYASPVTGDDHDRMFNWFNGPEMFDGALDLAARDRSRLMYFPSCCSDQEDASECRTHYGTHLDPVPVLARLPAATPKAAKAAKVLESDLREGPIWIGAKGHGTDAEIIAQFCAANAINADVWAGTATGYKGPSEIRFALISRLVWFIGGDAARTARLVRQSPFAQANGGEKFERHLAPEIVKAIRAAETGENPPRKLAFVGDVPPRVVTSDQVPPPPLAAAPVPDISYTRIDRTGQGNANLLVQLAGGNLRYVAETDQWLRWTNGRWEVDTHESFVTGFALQVSNHYREEGVKLNALGQSEEGRGGELMKSKEFLAHAAKCRNKKAIDEMISLARKIPGVAISVQDLDRKRHLLGVANGVVNLRTGKLQPDAREDYVTLRCAHAFNPDAKAPRFMLLIEEVTGFPIPPDRDAAGEIIAGTVGRYTTRPELAGYLLRVLGYSTTGEITEHKFFIFTGIGSNGKNVVVDVVRKVLGPYAQEVPSELLLARPQKSAQDAERPTPVVAGLKGVRMAVFSETTDGQKLDQGIIKKHVGQDTIRARGMRENGGEQQITHKSTLVTNHLPKLDHLEPAIKDRIANLPFDRRWNRPGIVDRNPALPNADPGLADYLLESEAEGILAALVKAAGQFYAVGLKPPQEVIATTTDYFNANDALGHWISTAMEQCGPTPGGTMAADLFKMFGDWCAAQGREIDPSNQTALGLKLGKLGYESKRSNRGVMWGLRKKLPAPPGSVGM